jgi:SAM-dependent methyltransferase
VVQVPVLVELLGIVLAETAEVRQALNAGAGEGLFTDLLLGLPGLKQLVEIDLSYDTYRRSRMNARHLPLQGSLTALPMDGGAIDLALCTEVLEHIVDDAAAVAELRRVLRPGGWLLMSVPTPPAPPDAAHVREGYYPEQLSGLLAEHGLIVVATRFCMFGTFKAMLRGWRFTGGLPRGVIWLLAQADRRLRLGTPMDLVVLARADGTDAGATVR